jgi:hypothetical protein
MSPIPSVLVAPGRRTLDNSAPLYEHMDGSALFALD